MPSCILNVDVPDLEAGVAFYAAAFGFTVGRRFDGFIELLGAEATLYLLEKPAGTHSAAVGGDVRRYERHWTPIHPDFVVENIEAATAKVLAAGAVQEGSTCEAPYGRLARFADPFGHGFCLIEFDAAGYDALLPPAEQTEG